MGGSAELLESNTDEVKFGNELGVLERATKLCQQAETMMESEKYDTRKVIKLYERALERCPDFAKARTSLNKFKTRVRMERLRPRTPAEGNNGDDLMSIRGKSASRIIGKGGKTIRML